MADRRSFIPNVPEHGDPDRKRVLNVLAQRRYRQRRKERIQALEVRATANPVSGSETRTAARSSEAETNSEEGLGMVYDNESSRREDHVIQRISPQPDEDSYNPRRPSLPFAVIDPVTPNPFIEFDFDFLTETIDIGPELQSFETSQFTFPDDATLEVLELRVLKAGLGIAEMLGCSDSVYDFTASRVFDSTTLPIAQLPSNLVSTDVQRRVPHHPIFDILPWPSVRTKFICIFAQPDQMRPPAARDPMAIMQLIFDMDDPAEGLRVTGSQVYEEENWEIGQAFFTNWWWALDRAVVDNSNYLRAKRGAEKLRVLPLN